MRDLHQIMKDIEPYIQFIFKHEDEFVKTFGRDIPPGGIASISFGANEIPFTYESEDENLTSDAITADELASWMRKTRGEYP